MEQNFMFWGHSSFAKHNSMLFSRKYLKIMFKDLKTFESIQTFLKIEILEKTFIFRWKSGIFQWNIVK